MEKKYSSVPYYLKVKLRSAEQVIKQQELTIRHLGNQTRVDSKKYIELSKAFNRLIQDNSKLKEQYDTLSDNYHNLFKQVHDVWHGDIPRNEALPQLQQRTVQTPQDTQQEILR